MQRLHSKSSNIYDVAIVGAGLTGLSLGLALERLGKKVVLLDEGDRLGGSNSLVTYNDHIFSKGLRFLPDSPEARSALDFLEGLLTTEIPRHSRTNQKLIYESGDFKEFLGFGDKAPASVDELNYFFDKDELIPQIGVHRWTELLLAAFQGEKVHPGYVTRFHVQDGQVTHLTYNTNKDIFAEQFVYCGGIKDMMPLFAREVIPAKIHQKVAKSNLWSTLCLDLIHREAPAESRSMHVLNYGTKEEPEYFIGRFDQVQPEEGATLNLSHWMSLLDQEVTEDSEQIASALKKMKKQLKKIYPDIFEVTEQERVSFMPSALGSIDLGLKNPLQLPGLANFFLGSAQLSPQQNLLGSLERSFTLTRHFESSVFIEEQGEGELESPPPELS